MIFGTIKDLEKYSFLEGTVRECLAYARAHDLSAFEKGRHEVSGDQIYVNIEEYETMQVRDRVWEAHRAHLDIHMILCGREQIDLNFIQNMTPQEYVEGNDFLRLAGERKTSVILEPGDFLICYPEDAHRTAIAADGPAAVKKAIFKLPLPQG